MNDANILIFDLNQYLEAGRSLHDLHRLSFQLRLITFWDLSLGLSPLDALNIGLAAILDKTSSLPAILTAIHRVWEGDNYLDDRIVQWAGSDTRLSGMCKST